MIETIIAIVSLVAGALFWGITHGATRAKIKGLEGYRHTTKAVQDETAAHSSDDDGVLRDLMRNRPADKR